MMVETARPLVPKTVAAVVVTVVVSLGARPAVGHYTLSSDDVPWTLYPNTQLSNLTAGSLTGIDPNSIGSYGPANMATSNELIGNSTARRGWSFVMGVDSRLFSQCNPSQTCPSSPARINDAVIGLCDATFDAAQRRSEFPYRNFPHQGTTPGDNFLLYGFRFYPATQGSTDPLTIVNNGTHDPRYRHCEPAETISGCVGSPIPPVVVRQFDRFTMRLSTRNTIEYLLNETLLLETVPVASQILRPCAFLKGTATQVLQTRWIHRDNFGSERWASVDSSIASLHATDAQLAANISAAVSSIANLGSVAAANHTAQETARVALTIATQSNFSAAAVDLQALRNETLNTFGTVNTMVAALNATDAALRVADTQLNSSIINAVAMLNVLRQESATNHSTQGDSVVNESARAIAAEGVLSAALSAAIVTLTQHTDSSVGTLSSAVDANISALRSTTNAQVSTLTTNLSTQRVYIDTADSAATADRALLRNETSQNLATGLTAAADNLSAAVLSLTGRIDLDVSTLDQAIEDHNATRVAEASAIRAEVLATEGGLNASIAAVNTSLLAGVAALQDNTTAELSILRARVATLEARLTFEMGLVASNFTAAGAETAEVAQGLRATNDATADNADTSDLYTAVAVAAVVAVMVAVVVSLYVTKRRNDSRDAAAQAKSSQNTTRASAPVLNPTYDPGRDTGHGHTSKYLDVLPESELATSVSGYAPVSYRTPDVMDGKSRVADYSTTYNESMGHVQQQEEEPSAFARVGYRAEGGSVRPSSIYRDNPLQSAEDFGDYVEGDGLAANGDTDAELPESDIDSKVTSFPC